MFGAPLSLPEQRLWESILLGAKRRQRTWREWLEGLRLSFFNPSSSPFGTSSGGAGGNASTPETGIGAGTSFGNSYPWLYPTSDFLAFDKWGCVALPAVNTPTFIGGTIANNQITWNAASNLPFIVPKGLHGFIKTIAAELVANGGAAWTPGVLPPQMQLAIQVNQNPAFDYGSFFYSPGLVQAPTPVAGIPIKELNLVAGIVTNLTLVVTTQFVTMRLQGYFYGKQFEPTGMAL